MTTKAVKALMDPKAPQRIVKYLHISTGFKAVVRVERISAKQLADLTSRGYLVMICTPKEQPDDAE